MTIDDSFLKREAAKRRFFTYMLGLLFLIFVTMSVIYFSGFFTERPTLARVIIYSELLLFVALYFVFRRRFDKRK